MQIRKLIKKFCLCFAAITAIVLGVGTTSVDAAGDWQYGDLSHQGAYYEKLEWRILSMTSSGARIEVRDTAWTSPSSYNYWTGHTAIYVDGKYSTTLRVPTDKHGFYGTESYSVSFDVNGYGTHRIDCKPHHFDNTIVTNPSASFVINIPKPKYDNNIAHWMGGFKYQEGNNGNKSSYNFANTKTGAVELDRTFTLNSGHATKIPNGYHLMSTFGTSSVTGQWQTYTMPKEIKQKNGVMSFEYYYEPYTYNIKYNVNGGNALSNPPSTYNVLYGPQLPTPTRKGYTFNGWIDSRTGSKVSSFNYNQNNKFSSANAMYSALNNRYTGDRTVTAQWTPNKYTITYEGNGGLWNGNRSWSDKVAYDSNYVTEKNFFHRKGYVFTGWNTSADGKGTDWTPWIGKPWKWTYDYNVTLYAQWKPITYTIIYNGNGHTSGSMKDQPMVYDKAANLYANTYKKDKASWLGWNTRADGKGTNYADQQSVSNLASTQGATVVLYAKWDHVPELTTKDDAIEKGQDISFGTILNNNASAKDKEDGNLNSSIQIEQVVYPDGTVVKKPSKGEKLDTNWENNQKITITVTVQDSYGHTVKKQFVVTIIDTLPNPPAPPVGGGQTKPKLYNRYINKGYEWSLDGDSVWTQKPEYQQELQDVLNSLE